jgi:hypothetical protein
MFDRGVPGFVGDGIVDRGKGLWEVLSKMRWMPPAEIGLFRTDWMKSWTVSRDSPHTPESWAARWDTGPILIFSLGEGFFLPRMGAICLVSGSTLPMHLRLAWDCCFLCPSTK